MLNHYIVRWQSWGHDVSYQSGKTRMKEPQHMSCTFQPQRIRHQKQSQQQQQAVAAAAATMTALHADHVRSANSINSRRRAQLSNKKNMSVDIHQK